MRGDVSDKFLLILLGFPKFFIGCKEDNSRKETANTGRSIIVYRRELKLFFVWDFFLFLPEAKQLNIMRQEYYAVIFSFHEFDYLLITFPIDWFQKLSSPGLCYNMRIWWARVYSVERMWTNNSKLTERCQVCNASGIEDKTLFSWGLNILYLNKQ